MEKQLKNYQEFRLNLFYEYKTYSEQQKKVYIKREIHIIVINYYYFYIKIISLTYIHI